MTNLCKRISLYLVHLLTGLAAFNTTFLFVCCDIFRSVSNSVLTFYTIFNSSNNAFSKYNSLGVLHQFVLGAEYKRSVKVQLHCLKQNVRISLLPKIPKSLTGLLAGLAFTGPIMTQMELSAALRSIVLMTRSTDIPCNLQGTDCKCDQVLGVPPTFVPDDLVLESLGYIGMFGVYG